MSAIVKIQEILGVTPDGVWGPKSQAALDALKHSEGWTIATATSFADPADIAAFKKCKQQGGSDHTCFAVGDNGIGLWNDDTTKGSGPCCALPNKVWEPFYHTARKKKVMVQKGDRIVEMELRDTSGSRDVIDLNPDACQALGLPIPLKDTVRWKWA